MNYRPQTIYYDQNTDFNKVIKDEMILYGKLHGEAWHHRLKGELELMQLKRNKAKLALQRAKAYASYVSQLHPND